MSLKDLNQKASVRQVHVEEDESGFTLVELMVTLLIVAILLSIAVPLFLGVTSPANDRATQSNLTNGLTETTLQYQDGGQSFLGVTAKMASAAPEFTWTTANSTCSPSQPNCISVSPVDVTTADDNQGAIIAAMSKTGTCWWVAQIQATPAVVPSSGFLLNDTVGQSGNQSVGSRPATISAAGTYYAELSGPRAAAACRAGYPMTASSGFNWGTSFSTAGRAG
jgi:prepilin-type N-terminal cleavage/methylation domain-containing protein